MGLRRGSRRVLFGLALAGLAVTAVPASAGERAYTAPYERQHITGSRQMGRPCVSGESVVLPLWPNPETGRLDSAVGVAARECRVIRQSFEHAWRLGTVPRQAVGRPAQIEVRLRVEELRIVSEGSASRGAWVTYAVAGLTRTLARLDCPDARCRGSSVRPGVVILRGRVAALPEALIGTLSLGAWAVDGTGRAGAELRGAVESVRITFSSLR